MAIVERTAELPTDVETAWGMLSDPAKLGGWLGGAVTIDLRPGGHFCFVRGDGKRMVGNVVEVVPRRRIVFTWWAPRPFGLPRRSRVAVALAAQGPTTVVSLREEQLAPPPVTIAPPRTQR